MDATANKPIATGTTTPSTLVEVTKSNKISQTTIILTVVASAVALIGLVFAEVKYGIAGKSAALFAANPGIAGFLLGLAVGGAAVLLITWLMKPPAKTEEGETGKTTATITPPKETDVPVVVPVAADPIKVVNATVAEELKTLTADRDAAQQRSTAASAKNKEAAIAVFHAQSASVIISPSNPKETNSTDSFDASPIADSDAISSKISAALDAQTLTVAELESAETALEKAETALQEFKTLHNIK